MLLENPSEAQTRIKVVVPLADLEAKANDWLGEPGACTSTDFGRAKAGFAPQAQGGRGAMAEAIEGAVREANAKIKPTMASNCARPSHHADG